MMQDIKYTKEVEPLILAYHNIFDELCDVWRTQYTREYIHRPELDLDGEWRSIIMAYESIDFERVQSSVLSEELRYLVPRRKEKSKMILERRKLKRKMDSSQSYF